MGYHIWDAIAEAYKRLNQKALMIKGLNLWRLARLDL